MENSISSGHFDLIGQANFVSQNDSNLIIYAQSSGPSLPVIRQNYSTGWKATVNGKPPDLIRVNYS